MSDITKEDFQEKFGSMLLNGLDSKGTYIPLRVDEEAGINVAVRPIVLRVSDEIVLVGGKLRCGYTLNSSKNQIKNVTAISKAVEEKRLQDFCKGFTWQNQDSTRLSTVIGVGIAATMSDKQQVHQHMTDTNAAEEFINKAETTYKEHNGVGFGTYKLAAIEILDAAWRVRNPLVFTENDKVKNSVELQHTPKHNVVSLTKKIKELAKEASDTPE